ncbi:hypothetical protein VE02_02684 [Pseudogymnoascus sp. 03VT05]|nr:hypothetical protein VE02_02684 [Pseudogymnoascus sp. 03VT05]
MKKLEASEKDAGASDDGRVQGKQQTAESQPGVEHHDSSIEKPPIRGASPRSISSPSLNEQIADVPYHEKYDGSDPSTSATIHTGLNGDSPITYHYLHFATPLPFTSSSPSSASSPPPPCPDLSPFTDPLLWSPLRKRFAVYLGSAATFVAAYNAGSYAPPAAGMIREFAASEIAVLTGITSFCVGFAITPMVLAPLSEIQGRYPVFVGAGIVFEAFQIACALTPSLAGMIVTRFLVGCGSSVFSSMIGGVISDLYSSNERNTPMALFAGAAIFGTGMGPLIASAIAQHLPWRWVFWVQSIACGVVVLAVILFLKESRGSVLLSKKAAALNKWYEAREAAGYVGFDMPDESGCGEVTQRIRWRVKADEERESLMKMIKISVWRPIHLLATEPVVFFFSLWVSFAWAVLYLTFSSLPLIFRTTYSFNLQECGFVFAAMSIGSILASYLAIAQDSHALALAHFFSRLRPGHPPPTQEDPEIRLAIACLHSPLLPIGLFWLGWTANPGVHWFVPCIGITISTMGIYAVYLAAFNYLADVYHKYASSALAAQSFCRNMMGAVFPLVTAALFGGLGIGGACSMLGGIAILLALVPWVLILYGPAIRRRSKFASEIM